MDETNVSHSTFNLLAPRRVMVSTRVSSGWPLLSARPDTSRVGVVEDKLGMGTARVLRPHLVSLDNLHGRLHF